MKRLKEIRKRRKLTQEDMAKLLHISRPAYTAYEIGRNEPGIPMLKELSKILGVSIDYLVENESNVEKQNKEIKEHLEEIKQILIKIENKKPKNESETEKPPKKIK